MDFCLSGAISLTCDFPAKLVLQSPGAFPQGAAGVVDWVRAHLPALRDLLTASGAVLLRGFPLRSAEDFSALVEAFGWRDLAYEDSLSLAVRTPVCARVCTTNDGRSGGLVFHHEQAAAPLFPSRLFFFCETPAPEGTGGGTGLSPSWALLERLESAFPQFVADCERLGIAYRLALPAEGDASKGVGRSWGSCFGVSTRAACEARMAALGYTHTWGEGGLLHCVSPVLPPLRTVSGPRGAATRVFYNQIVAQVIGNAKEFAAQMKDGGVGSAPPLTFGDGALVPLEPVEFALRVCEELAVDVQWERGDVALIDNYTVMHARRPWAGEGPRRVLASLALD